MLPIELDLWDEKLQYKSNVWKYEILDKTRKKESVLSKFSTIKS